MDLTAAELTVLGLIIERPQHGYDVEQVIEQRGIRQWTEIGFSSIYYLLRKLEDRELVEVAEAAPSPKARRVFRATALGRRVAASNVEAFITKPGAGGNPLLVGVANLSLLPPDAYTGALCERLASIDERLAAVSQARDTQSPLPLPAEEVFSYSLALLEAERSWLAKRVEATDEGD